ncbi:MAG TPA: hypothetical protein VMM77_08940 [Gemmatimonadaceae bacterium]|nr:hypothetical protein [Gemmatimonadaceae bacterium]
MRIAAAALLSILLFSSAQAQSADFSNPARPRLPAGADTNDARVYAAFANASRSAGDAYAGFVWAHRLRPARLDYLSGMVGALAAGRYELWSDRRRKDRRDVASILSSRLDSLEEIIAFRDPLFGLPALNGTCGARPMEAMDVEELVRRGMRDLRAGCYYGTIAYLEEAARRDTMLEHLLQFRAMAWHMARRPQEAAADLQRAMVGVRRLRAQSIEQPRVSTAMLEYVLGMMYTRFNDRVSARRAFERAIGEDLSFYMAHVRLAELAMVRGDLNGAIDALSLASQMRPDDALVLEAYAHALRSAKRYVEAHAAYAQAITHAPYYADLRFAQAELFDLTGNASAARDAYREYITRAAGHDSSQVQFAGERISTMESAEVP